jgi:hypothetical protein
MLCTVHIDKLIRTNEQLCSKFRKLFLHWHYPYMFQWTRHHLQGIQSVTGTKASRSVNSSHMNSELTLHRSAACFLDFYYRLILQWITALLLTLKEYKAAKIVAPDVLLRLYPGVLYFQNAIMFYSTRVNVTWLTLVRNIQSPLGRFLRSSRILNSVMSRTLEHRLSIELCNKCGWCRQIFAKKRP